ncbi:MAG: FtsX-like permease family protein [Methanobacteriota archaeon]|nr:MAG: FtsX-like permease family protein [Euryarchaeota archaeon]
MDTATTLLLVVGLVALAVLGWAGRKRFPLRIGAGNFFRRKTQVAIVVAGLLIGTAIISSSFIIQSTFDYTVRAAVFRALDAVDEVVFVASPTGTRRELVVDDRLRRQESGPVPVRAVRPDEGAEVVRRIIPDHRRGGFEEARRGIDDRAVQLVAWGDGLVVNVGGPQGLVRFNVSVHSIVRDAGRGAWDDGENLFLPLDALQAALSEAGKINTITVANVGGVTQGYLRSDDVVREMTPYLPTTPTFTIAKAKADSIDGASRNIDQLSQVFVLLGFFTVIAGVLLIINIFVMLAEERKGEMGVARALGMRRKNLVQSFVSEGLLYALLSSLVGTFAGLLVAGVILWGFSQVFGASAFGGTGFILTWTDSDLISGFAIGFLITMATIGRGGRRIGPRRRRARRGARPTEPPAPGCRAGRTRVRPRGPHDAGPPAEGRLHRGRGLHRRLGAEPPEVLQHRERGHHAVHCRGPPARVRRPPHRHVQQRLRPRPRNADRAPPHVATRRPHGDRVPDEQEVPHGGHAREHRPRDVHDRDDVGDPGRGQLLDRHDERPGERRIRPAGFLRHPGLQLERGIRRLQRDDGIDEHHPRAPADPGARSGRRGSELHGLLVQHDVRRRAVRLGAPVSPRTSRDGRPALLRLAGPRSGVPERGCGLGGGPQ